MQIPVYVINLDRSTERLENFNRSMLKNGVSYFRVAAVDARELTEVELFKQYDAVKNQQNYFTQLKTSEIACFLSHRKAWTTFLESSDQAFGIFLEDDVELNVSLSELNNTLSAIDWKSEPLTVKLYQSKIRLGRQLNCIGKFNLFDPYLPPLGTQAQVINRQAAELLLEHTKIFYEPLDVAMQRWWNIGIKILVLRPNMVQEVSANIGGSTLAVTGRQSIKNRILRELRRPYFRFKLFLRSIVAKFNFPKK